MVPIPPATAIETADIATLRAEIEARLQLASGVVLNEARALRDRLRVRP